MENKQLTKGSKFLSYILRHDPGAIGLSLDAQGWALVDDIIALSKTRKPALSRELIEQIVASCEKQRFSFDESGNRIRANQGHSIKVDLGLQPQTPPDVLYHGTATRFLKDILKVGLAKKGRHHVHLTESEDTASTVGIRRGMPVILKVDAARMVKEGHEFYVSDNGVWLVDTVPARFLEVI